MRNIFFGLSLISLILLAGFRAGGATSEETGIPEGYWDLESTEAILEKTLTIRMAPGLTALTSGERTAIEKLLEVGKIFQQIYEDSLHHQALQIRNDLLGWDSLLDSSLRTRNLVDLYRLFRGPIATTLDNRRVPFLPVDPKVPGKNVYPIDLTKEDMDEYLRKNPQQRKALLHLRSVVREIRGDQVRADLQVLDRFPILDTLHPGLRKQFESLTENPDRTGYYAVPYSVVYADELRWAYDLLNGAADAVEPTDPSFGRYLRLRARDLLSDDYDAGDAAWVTGRFGFLNAQIGSYETYDDELYGAKSFFGLSLLIRDPERSTTVRRAVKGIQGIEDLLPYENKKKVKEDISIGVYRIIADFGQTRGRNTATILPNETHLARQYGRTILLRANILTDPDLFRMEHAKYAAAVHPDHRGDLTPEGRFQRTLWHEIGHYLGADRTADGRELGIALEEDADLLEELKADLVSLFAVEPLKEQGYYDRAGARAVYADGIHRVLQKTRPRREQPYQTMQLMQWNYFLEKGVLTWDPEAGSMRISYAKYPATVRSLLEQVLGIFLRGDRKEAGKFIDRYSAWRDDLHGRLAEKMRAAETYRYVLVRYAALGE